MDTFIRLLSSVLDRAAAVLFASALTINVANIVGRYAFHTPLFWAEEVTTILVIWSICLLAFRLTAKGEHLVTDIVRPFLRPPGQRALLILVNTFVVLVTAYLAWQSYLVVELVARYGQVTNAAEIPKWIANGSILACFSLACLGSLLRLASVLDLSRPLPGTEPAEIADLVHDLEKAP